jgi:hypothetical protein
MPFLDILIQAICAAGRPADVSQVNVFFILSIVSMIFSEMLSIFTYLTGTEKRKKRGNPSKN